MFLEIEVGTGKLGLDPRVASCPLQCLGVNGEAIPQAGSPVIEPGSIA